MRSEWSCFLEIPPIYCNSKTGWVGVSSRIVTLTRLAARINRTQSPGQALLNIMLILCDVDQMEAFRCGNEAPSNTAKIEVDPAKLSQEMRNYIAVHLWFGHILEPCYDGANRNLHALSDPSYPGFLEAIGRGMVHNGISCHETVEILFIEQPAVHIQPDLALTQINLAEVHRSDGHRVSGIAAPAKHPGRITLRKARTKKIYSSKNKDSCEEDSPVDSTLPSYLSPL